VGKNGGDKGEGGVALPRFEEQLEWSTRLLLQGLKVRRREAAIFQKGGVREGRLRCKRNRGQAASIYTIGGGPKCGFYISEYIEENGEYHSKKDIREYAKESGKYGAEVESALCFAHRDPTLTFSSPRHSLDIT
jgi:hypothetical protein